MKEETKTMRILWLYDALCAGKTIDRREWAETCGVSERSVRRDVETIRRYLEEKDDPSEGVVEISQERCGKYAIRNAERGFLREGELLGICKILIESRAFRKEELQSLLDRLLRSVMAEDAKKQIQSYIENELFNYLDPEHKNPDAGWLWTAAKAIRMHHILSFSYYKMGAVSPVFRRVRPVGILFSEYYFYLMGIEDSEEGEAHFRKAGPHVYRLDRMGTVEDTGESFCLPYSERFKEGEFKNRVQFMYGGEPYVLTFCYYGPSIEAVLDRLPTAEILREENGGQVIRAEAAGTGILMWLLSQGSMVEVLSPQWMRDRWLNEAKKILSRAEKRGKAEDE